MIDPENIENELERQSEIKMYNNTKNELVEYLGNRLEYRPIVNYEFSHIKYNWPVEIQNMIHTTYEETLPFIIRSVNLKSLELSRPSFFVNSVFGSYEYGHVTVRDMDMSRAKFMGASICALFENVNLTEADFREATFENTNFVNSDLTNADFSGAEFPVIQKTTTTQTIGGPMPIHSEVKEALNIDQDTIIDGVKPIELRRKMFDAQTNVTQRELIRDHLQGIEGNLKIIDFEDGSVGFDLREVDFSGKRMTGYILPNSIFGQKMSDVNLNNAVLRKAKLMHVDLTRANLSGADLRGAYLMGANLTGANLNEADLEGANLDGAILDGAIIDYWKPKRECEGEEDPITLTPIEKGKGILIKGEREGETFVGKCYDIDSLIAWLERAEIPRIPHTNVPFNELKPEEQRYIEQQVKGYKNKKEKPENQEKKRIREQQLEEWNRMPTRKRRGGKRRKTRKNRNSRKKK